MFLRITNWLDIAAKWVAGFVAILFVLNILIPPVTDLTKAFYAWRFGVVGVVKYELGSEPSEQSYPERKPSVKGQLYLLSPNPIGQREWYDLRFGDILQSKSEKHLRLEDGCGGDDRQNCGSSPRIFTLAAGECVIVLDPLYESASSSSCTGRDEERVCLEKLSGGWVRVGTTSCGLFN